MMGVQNIVALLLCISFALFITFPNPQISGSDSALNTFTKINNVTNQIASSNIIIPDNVPALGSQSFPNPFSLFGGIASLIISFASIVTDTFKSLAIPYPFNLFLITTLSILMIITGYTWWKGNGN